MWEQHNNNYYQNVHFFIKENQTIPKMNSIWLSSSLDHFVMLPFTLAFKTAENEQLLVLFILILFVKCVNVV